MTPRPVDPDYVTDSNQLQAALDYASRGFRVYPCNPGAKVPAGQWGNATAEPLEVVQLWNLVPGGNTLVACGEASGLTVLDFDVKNGQPGEALAAELLGDGWKDRYCYSTTPSGGYHVWCPFEPVWGNQKHVPGLDCQGEGSYVVVPPSRLVAGLCGPKDTPGPYLLVNPHLPLVSTLDAAAHARVTAALGYRVQAAPAGAIDLPTGWETVDCPQWAEFWPQLAARVQQFIHTGDPDARPPGMETARGFDTRSGAVMGVATNLMALRRPGSASWLLSDAQVLQLLAGLEHVAQYAHEHAGSAERAPWWLWRYNVVPARDNVRRSAFDALGAGAAVAPDRGGNGEGGTRGVEAAESVTDATVDPPGPTPSEPTPPEDPLQAVLRYVATLTPPYTDGVRAVCHEIARLGLDELGQMDAIEALHERTEVPRGTLKKQLAGEVRTAVRERRDAEKRAPAGVLSSYVYVEQAGALWKLNPPGWVTLTSFRAMWGVDTSTSALEPGSGVPRCSRATYRPQRQWAPGFNREASRWILDPDTQQMELNTWEPSPLTPMLGVTDEDVRPWLEHLDRVLQVPAGDREHLLDWLACTVSRPDEKINHMLLLGGGQGTGKDTLLHPVIQAAGKANTLVIPGADAVSGFDAEKLGHCALMVLQELSTGDLAEARRAYNALKVYAAAPPDELIVNVKGVKQFFVPNLVNVVAVTNDRRALRIEQDDRRSYMVWCDGRKDAIHGAYFDDLWRWYDTGGTELVAGWLLQRDLAHFSPKGSPPATSWRGQAQEDSLPDVAHVVRDLIVDEEGPAGDEVATAADLLPMVRARMAGAKNPPTERSVSYALVDLGYHSRRVNEPAAMAKAAGRLSRRKATFYLLRNETRWHDAHESDFWISGKTP